MKKKIILIVLVALIACGLLVFVSLNPASTSTITESTEKATKDESGVDWSTYTVYDIELGNGNVSITKAGVYNLSGKLNGIITINTNDNVKIILNGVTIKSSNSPAIYIEKAKNTYIEIKGKNTIKTTTTDKLDAAIYSKDDLYLYGDGTLTINSNKDGIAGKDDLYILSGTYNITATNDGIKGKDTVNITNGKFKIISSLDGIQAETSLTIYNGTFNITSGKTTSEESQKGLKAGTTLLIKKGTFIINSIDDAIHSNETITIDNGTYTITTTDDGMHADNEITINKGTININKSYEGIEAYKITINDGTINVTSSDDGINIGGGNDNSGQGSRQDKFMDSNNGGLLTINGGTIYVNSEGDGLDSNGSITMTSGVVHVDGPTNNGNGALDYNGTFDISGGELIAVGSSGMVQNVSNSSTQNTVLVTLSSQASGSIEFAGITYSPKKSYQSIVISSPSLKTNETYTLTAGNNTQSVSLTSTVTSVGTRSNGGGRGGFQR